MTRVVNLTPYLILFRPKGQETTWLPAASLGLDARVDVEFEYTPGPHGISVQRRVFGRIHNLPGPVQGTIYIVPPRVLNHPRLCDRTDVFAAPEEAYENAQRAIADGAQTYIPYDILRSPDQTSGSRGVAMYAEAFGSLQGTLAATHPDLAIPFRRLLGILASGAPDEDIKIASYNLNRDYRMACKNVLDQGGLSEPDNALLLRAAYSLGDLGPAGAADLRQAVLAYKFETL